MVEDADLGKDKTCFIVSPIGNKLDPRGTDGRLRYEDNIQMWENVLEPACEVFSLKPVRADKLAEQGEITEQIFQYLRDADVVIADLSGANPNVMYELGLRHTRDKITIQIGEHGRLPFDVNTIRTIQFKRTEAGLIEARDGLIESIRSGLQGKGRPVAATRVWNDGRTVAAEAVADAVERSFEQEDPGSNAEEPGFIDVLAEGEGALEDVSGILGEASGFMQHMGEMSRGVTERVRQSDERGKGFAGRLLIARELARSLAEPANEFEGLAGQYMEAVGKLDTMVDYILTRMENEETEDDEKEELDDFLLSLLKLIDAANGAEVGLTEFLTEAIGIRKIARDLVPVSKTIERSLNRYIKGGSVISDWRPRIEGLLGEGEAA